MNTKKGQMLAGICTVFEKKCRETSRVFLFQTEVPALQIQGSKSDPIIISESERVLVCLPVGKPYREAGEYFMMKSQRKNSNDTS